MSTSQIRVGVGGWIYEAWRETFYPKGLSRKGELAYASRHLTSIEVNGTFYRTPTRETIQQWHDETPDEFVFSFKAPRYVTNRRVLAEAGPNVRNFVECGLDLLGKKLGPINWRMGENKKFEPEDFEAFLDLLPKGLRHAVEVRHESFRCEKAVDLARKHEVAIVLAGDSRHPVIPDVTAPFVYMRIMGTSEEHPKGYSERDLDVWTSRARLFAAGKYPDDLERFSPKPTETAPRDVYLYVINGFKQSNPAAAMAFIERLKAS